MTTKKDLVESCRDFNENATEFLDFHEIRPSQNETVLGVITHPAGFRLRFCFVGSLSLKERPTHPDDLTVVFSGAVSRGTVRPTFHRIVWADQFNGSALYFSDPVLDDDINLELGWYIGRPEWDLMGVVADVVKHFQQHLSAKNTYVYGSSGGGYAALSLAREMNGLRVISINPQIYLENWTRGAVELFSQAAFGKDRESFIKDHPELNDVSEGLGSDANGNRILVYQNLSDTWRDGQIEKLVKERGELLDGGSFRVNYFYREANHAAEKIEWTRDLFSYVSEWGPGKLDHRE